MKYLMWALLGLLLLAACAQDAPETKNQDGAGAQLLNLEQYQQENSYAFECNTTGFEPHTFQWDFGDGTARETTYKGVAHTYFKSGTYTVRCTAIDDLQNETSSMTINVEATAPEYDDNILGDLDLVDLLSDPMNGTEETPMLNWTHNATYTPPRNTPDDGYDYAFDFDFDEPETTTPTRTSSTNNSINRTTANNTNQTNTTGIGSIIPGNRTNTTDTTNDPFNGTGNESDGPFEWPELNLTDNETVVLPPVIEKNDSDQPTPLDEKKERKIDEQSTDDKKAEAEPKADLKASHGKLKKELGLKGLKVKI